LNDVVKELKAMKRAGRKVFWVKLHGGPLQMRGLPDMVIIVGGRTFWVELKRPGGKPTPLQAQRIKTIREAGGIADCVTSVEELRKLLTTTYG
jgi:hypothetical protein